ncbi:hypothetical protein JZ751_008179 [Albula glossodonta]|uniref:Small membrane A-kinase anchor protein n=1 Tax=Albula glossodonta TaxID=121402 RepID=A0A8T2MPL2_9TELE|nr:hypothetical protein JZ751_008179 [Albula glossodonta]
MFPEFSACLPIYMEMTAHVFCSMGQFLDCSGTPSFNPALKYYKIHMMGCLKSKHRKTAQHFNSIDKIDGKPGKRPVGERVTLIHSEVGPEEEIPHVNPVLLDYAQRLSQDIVTRAVKQWAEVDSRYSDIPYIECDVP